MSLYQRISDYAESIKTTDYNDHHVRKHVFTEIAKLIHANKLTVAVLTNLLADLNEDDRYKLFYLEHKQGNSFKQKASSDGEDAQWIAELYHSLHVPMSEVDLAIIVAEGISPRNAAYLKNSRYQFWQEHPSSKLAISHLEHELKGLLDLDAKDLSLAEALSSVPKEKLDKSLLVLQSAAPAYLRVVVDQL